MRIGIMATLSALVLGMAAQAARAGGDYSDAIAYALNSTGVVMGRDLCGAADLNTPVPQRPGPSCDVAWQQVDNDPNIKFIQTAGNVLFEVYPNGQIWIKTDALNFRSSGWISAGVDAGVTSPTQLTAGRTTDNLPGVINVYKASNGKLFKWLGSSSWQELTTFSAKGVVQSVSGDIVAIATGNTGLRTLFHITTGQQISDRQYGPLVGTIDFEPGNVSGAYFARFINGTTSNQENVLSSNLGSVQYGPAFTFSDIKGFAVAATDAFGGSNSVFMLLPRSTTFGDNNVLMVNEAANNQAGVVVRGGLSAGVAAATSYEVFGAGMRSYLWVLKPTTAGGDIFEYKCSTTSCGFVTGPSSSFRPYVQVVATSNWTPGDPDM